MLEPFNFAKGIIIKWSAAADGRAWPLLSAEGVFFPHRSLEDGSPGLMATAMPVGRVLAKVTSERKFGVHQYLACDAMFSRWQDGDRTPATPPTIGAAVAAIQAAKGKAWVQERPEGEPPFDANLGDVLIAGRDGRMPGVEPFIENETIHFMGPEERKFSNPYGVIIRGSGMGFPAAEHDNYFFPGDHWHIADHRGPEAGGGKDDQGHGASTRVYDIDPETGEPSEHYRAGLDKVFIVKNQAGGCALGRPDRYTLALNFSGDTGPGYGLMAFKSNPPKGGPPRDDKSTATPERGDGPQAVMGYGAYERGGPFTGGHPKADKHRHSTTRHGELVNCTHLHINSKWTDESVRYDGRLNIQAVDEPRVGGGIFPVRTFIMFNPFLADPYCCEDQIGGYDLHTRIMRTPIYDESTPNKGESSANKPDSTPNKDTEATPNKDTTPNKYTNQTVPIPPVDVGPLEERVPSIEGQPTPGNSGDEENPIPGAGGWTDPDPGGGAQPRDPERETGPGGKFNAVNNSTVATTGHTWTDHLLSPRVGHLKFFYEQRHAARQGKYRGMVGFPAAYVRQPKLLLTDAIQPDIYESGTANGVALFVQPELRAKHMAYDYAGAVPTLSVQTLGIFDGNKLAWGRLGAKKGSIVQGAESYLDANDNLYIRAITNAGAVKAAGVVTFEPAIRIVPAALPVSGTAAGELRFDSGAGNAPKYWDGAAWQGFGGGGGEANTASNVGGGVGVFQSKVGVDLRFHSLVGYTSPTITNAIVDIGDEIRIQSDLAFPLKIADNTATPQITGDGFSEPASTGAGMYFDQEFLEGMAFKSTNGDIQIQVTNTGVKFSEKVTIVGGVDPTYISFTAQGSRPADLTSLGNGQWLKEYTSTVTQRVMHHYDGSNDQLLMAGGFTRVRSAITLAASTLTAADMGQLCPVTASVAGIVITLPSAAGVPAGAGIGFVRTDASGQTAWVQRGGADTINSNTDVWVLQESQDSGKARHVVIFISDGVSNWTAYSQHFGGPDTVLKQIAGGTGFGNYTKGDLLVATGFLTLAKRPVGADGTVLTADSAEATGMKWASGGGGGLSEAEVLGRMVALG